MISKTKILLYSGNMLMLAMWWAMFAVATNWWAGLILAVCLTSLQEIIRRNVKF
jgi:hypothetical protein